MPTDLRDALRDLLTTRDEDEQERLARLEAAIAALADAPPTVAELLPLVVDSTREVRWTDADGDQWRAFAVGGGRPIGFAFRRKSRGDWHDGNPCDLTQPAQLVEVTP